MQFMSRTGMAIARRVTRRCVARASMSHLCGFSLIELAVVLVIIAIFLSAILVPLTTQVAQRKTSDTQKTLEEIREALLGYAIARGQLPCPASSTSNGIESPSGGGTCTNPYNGYVPAATLGLQATDSQGYSIDAWGTRIRYAVTKDASNTFTFTTANGMRNATLTGMASTYAPDLYVCPTSTGITTTTCGTGNPYLTNSAVAVIYSLGPNYATGGTGADEAANPNPNSANNDRVFVYHTRSDSVAANGEFDDIVIWLSANVLFSRMVSAGQLP